MPSLRDLPRATGTTGAAAPEIASAELATVAARLPDGYLPLVQHLAVQGPLAML